MDITRPRTFRFALYEADELTGELRKHGRRLRLSGQPFQILLLLLDSRGELVTREQIRSQLWPDGTFVDFDHSLNSAVNKLREILNDSATNPRFIETLAKRGYRFLVPVEIVGEAPSAATAQPTQPAPPIEAVASGPASPPTSPGSKKSLLTAREDLPPLRPSQRVRIAFILAQVMYLAFYIAALANLEEIDELLRQSSAHSAALLTFVIATAAIGIPTRLFLLSAAALRVPRFSEKYLRLFPLLLLLDLAWALSPLLMVRHIGIGLALAAVAALLLLPFGQRTLVLMLAHPE